ncbi:MAPEG family protein [Pseudovibrio axinellae]|uniref:MAPEG family protein n=1 Tax=Pseudovibrio axinellae TaxID=989403 RepID=A0A166A0W1_9HYPH|nr:MAPEG family protein [Pseudovibrio axinellae]KZL20500.1 MAPEG family protein [Pseudovibrio axinellae]SEQ36499.1 Uncharacterized conserved protein, MAPEG superfamily [Pseudovibrio axinellae]
MPFPLWTILIAGLLPWISVLPAKFSRDFNNSNPRDPAYWKEGFRLRARSAELNALEAFPLYAVSVLVATAYGGDPIWIEKLCGLFIAIRVLYIVCYWLDRASLRSIVWFIGLVCSVALLTSPAWS